MARQLQYVVLEGLKLQKYVVWLTRHSATEQAVADVDSFEALRIMSPGAAESQCTPQFAHQGTVKSPMFAVTEMAPDDAGDTVLQLTPPSPAGTTVVTPYTLTTWSIALFKATDTCS
jgi:hypothetical protein